MTHTLVDELQFGDDVQSNFGELILEHLKEHGEEMVDGSTKLLTQYSCEVQEHILLLAEDGSQATDLGTKSGTDMLRGIGDKILNAGHDVAEEDGAVDESTETGDLASDGGSYFGLVVLEELDECRDKVARNNLLIHSLGNL